MSCAFHDLARFEPGDHPDLVEAAFCCQRCLHGPALVIVGTSASGGCAWCYCAVCHAHTEVGLDWAQLLRLTLAPPRGAPIHVVAGYET
jgi:hypothetical protein